MTRPVRGAVDVIYVSICSYASHAHHVPSIDTPRTASGQLYPCPYLSRRMVRMEPSENPPLPPKCRVRGLSPVDAGSGGRRVSQSPGGLGAEDASKLRKRRIVLEAAQRPSSLFSCSQSACAVLGFQRPQVPQEATRASRVRHGNLGIQGSVLSAR